MVYKQMPRVCERIDHEGGVGGVILVSQNSEERSGGGEIVSAGFVISPRAGERASEIQELCRRSQVGERVGKIERRFDDRLGGVRLAEVQVDESQRIEHLEPLMRRLRTIQAHQRAVTRLQTGVCSSAWGSKACSRSPRRKARSRS